MVTRIWHGRTKPEHADEYLSFLQGKGTAEYLDTPGNLSVKIWRQQMDDCCHFFTVTEWDTEKSIAQFSGSDIQRAIYYPEDDYYLLEKEAAVIHYESYIIR